MWETITMTTRDQRRAWIVTKVTRGELAIPEVALFLVRAGGKRSHRHALLTVPLASCGLGSTGTLSISTGGGPAPFGRAGCM
jgi:hypothetical protein